jgi:hypothetical protein
MLGRLLNLFQEHVGGALKHAIHVFDDDDAPRRGGGHLLGGSDDLTHLIDTNSHLVRGQHRDIRMRAGKHLLAQRSCRDPGFPAPPRMLGPCWNGPIREVHRSATTG